MATLNVKNLPEALYRRLKQRAKAQRRSVAQEVTQILSNALDEQEGDPANGAGKKAGLYIERMRGRATTGLSTEEIMRLTRGAHR